MSFGVPKPDGSTSPIVNLSDKTIFNHSITDLIDQKLCTVEYAPTKQVVETIQALGKNAWCWAKDSKDGWYNASVNKKDIHKLGFMFDEKNLYVSTPSNEFIMFPKHFYGFHAFLIWDMKQDGPDLHYKEVDESIINLNNFIKDADVIKDGSTAILAILFHYLDDILRGHPVKDEA